MSCTCPAVCQNLQERERGQAVIYDIVLDGLRGGGVVCCYAKPTKQRGQVLIRALCASVRLRRSIVWSLGYEAWPVTARANNRQQQTYERMTARITA